MWLENIKELDGVRETYSWVQECYSTTYGGCKIKYALDLFLLENDISREAKIPWLKKY